MSDQREKLNTRYREIVSREVARIADGEFEHEFDGDAVRFFIDGVDPGITMSTRKAARLLPHIEGVQGTLFFAFFREMGFTR